MSTATFNIGDKVNFTGWKIIARNEELDANGNVIELAKPKTHTIIPAKNLTIVVPIIYKGSEFYIIEHPNGFLNKHQMQNCLKTIFPIDIVEAAPLINLKEDKKYILSDSSELEPA